MKKICLLIIALSNFCFAQKTEEEIINQEGNNCKKNKNNTIADFNKNFPLNATQKILLVSFEYFIALKIDPKTGEYIGKNKEGIPIINNKVIYEDLKEFKIFNPEELQKLFNILYNYGVDHSKNLIYENSTSCYSPRNAIIFLNEKNEIVEFIEICFSCSRTFVLKKTQFGEFCEGKLDLIKSFFIEKGIQYGTIGKYY
jgi:hypothetical protein